MDEIIANLDYSDEVKSNAILAEYDVIKKKLDEEMLNWENATEELMMLE
jgi:hypothetical protein